MGCTFCATGTMGIRGDLCQGEILEQIVHADHILAEEAGKSCEPMEGNISNDLPGDKVIEVPDMIRNVVFMGMVRG